MLIPKAKAMEAGQPRPQQGCPCALLFHVCFPEAACVGWAPKVFKGKWMQGLRTHSSWVSEENPFVSHVWAGHQLQ
jgi:hypothetical protein